MSCPIATSTLRVYQFRHVPSKLNFQINHLFLAAIVFAFADDKHLFAYKSSHRLNPNSFQMSAFGCDSSDKENANFLGDYRSDDH